MNRIYLEKYTSNKVQRAYIEGASNTTVFKSIAKIKLSEPRTHNIDFW
jgi:hypothetical protein